MDYLQSKAVNLFDKVPDDRSILTTAPISPPAKAYNFRNPSFTLLANTPANFMYANWIGLYAKTPEQAGNYLFSVQGMFYFIFVIRLLFRCDPINKLYFCVKYSYDCSKIVL